MSIKATLVLWGVKVIFFHFLHTFGMTINFVVCVEIIHFIDLR